MRKGSEKGYHMAKRKPVEWYKEKAEGAYNIREGTGRDKC